jgi:hypothetical protein
VNRNDRSWPVAIDVTAVIPLVEEVSELVRHSLQRLPLSGLGRSDVPDAPVRSKLAEVILHALGAQASIIPARKNELAMLYSFRKILGSWDSPGLTRAYRPATVRLAGEY